MPVQQGTQIVIRKPDDWHLHLRDLPVMKDVLPHSVQNFARGVVMPNLKPPVRTVEEALQYRERIRTSLPAGESFEPLMTLYLTDTTPPEELRKAKESGHIFGVKLYPAGATTNSEFGITSVQSLYSSFELMEKLGLPLLVHGEISDPDVDIFDRESVFIERYLHTIVKRFSALRIVLEHISTRDAVSFILSAGENVAATITPHHLLINRNDLLAGGIRPHHYCLPIVKREEDRLSLVNAAVSGNPKFFAGTDSAPHAQPAKESPCGSAGIYSASSAVQLYAEVFDEEEALDKLEAFLSRNGAGFHGLPPNEKKIRLTKREQRVPTSFPFGEESVIPFRAGGHLHWSLETLEE